MRLAEGEDRWAGPGGQPARFSFAGYLMLVCGHGRQVGITAQGVVAAMRYESPTLPFWAS